MSKDPSLDRLKELAQPFLDDSDSAHDLSHALRVMEIARAICEAEGGNMDLVLAAALIHDIGCAPKHLGNDKGSRDRSLAIGGELLEKAGYGQESMSAILEMVKDHGFSKGIVPATLEGRILQDADRLDAMGAVGIARVFLVSGATNRPMYDIHDPWARDRELDDGAYGLDHFFLKLLKLKDGMHTGTGSKMAQKRHARILGYIGDLKEEI